MRQALGLAAFALAVSVSGCAWKPDRAAVLSIDVGEVRQVGIWDWPLQEPPVRPVVLPIG